MRYKHKSLGGLTGKLNEEARPILKMMKRRTNSLGLDAIGFLLCRPFTVHQQILVV